MSVLRIQIAQSRERDRRVKTQTRQKAKRLSRFWGRRRKPLKSRPPGYDGRRTGLWMMYYMKARLDLDRRIYGYVGGTHYYLNWKKRIDGARQTHH